VSAIEKQPKMLPARITFLEMAARPTAPSVPAPVNEPLALMRAENCPVHFYRYIYQQVGKPHHWLTRRRQSDAELAEVLAAPATLLYILYCGGCPAGFAEILLDKMAEHNEADIMYFGLMAEYQGRGLARFFFDEIVRIAWEQNIDLLRIQTNSLDSPRALQLYQRAGFTPVGTENVEIEAWE